MSNTVPIPDRLDGLLTESERQRFGVLARNAAIRERFTALRAAGRTVSASLVALSQDRSLGLSVDGVRRVIYPLGDDESRPWLA